MEVYKSFSTERLILRPTSIEDAEFILKLMNSPKWIKNIGDRHVDTLKDAEDYISNRMRPQLKKLGYGNYTVIRKSDNQKIGTCGLYDREGLEDVDIGFAFLPSYEKQGYGFEAAHKIMNIAFSEFGIESICGITSKTNKASQKLLIKLGLRYEGPTHLPNEEEELALYRIKQ